MLLTQQVANGLVLGAGYALVAVGITLVLRVLDLVNFAHGDLYLLGGLGVYVGTTQFGLPFAAATVVSVALVVVAAYIELRLIRSIHRAEPFNAILATFAIGAVVMNATNLYLGGSAATVEPMSGALIRVGGIVMSTQRLLVMVAATVLFGGLILGLQFTRAGRQIRAVAQNPLGAEVCGIRVQTVHTRLFLFAGAAAALAGSMLAPVVQVNPHASLGIMMKAFVVVIMGGVGSVPGAAVGGAALGVIESLGGTYLGSEWTNAFGFALLLVVLMMRPQGIFGART